MAKSPFLLSLQRHPRYTLALAAFVLALASTALAIPRTSDNQCATSSMRCCSSVEPAGSDRASPILDALKLQLDANQHVGMACDPINPTTVGGGQSCTAMPLCCNGNHYGELVAFGWLVGSKWLIGFAAGGVSVGCSPIPLVL